MKKLLIAAALLLCTFAASAQSFGITGGFTSSSTNVKDFDTKSVSLYHVGVVYEIPLVGGFAIQPGITYQMKGATLDKYADDTNNIKLSTLETKVGYLEVPVQIQWGPDLALFRPYVFAEPFVGYALNVNNDFDDIAGLIGEDGEKRNEWKDNAIKRLEYGCGFGVGLDFWQLQLSVQYFMNLGGLADDNGEVGSDAANAAIKNIVNSAYDKKNFSGIKVSAVLFF